MAPKKDYQTAEDFMIEPDAAPKETGEDPADAFARAKPTDPPRPKREKKDRERKAPRAPTVEIVAAPEDPEDFMDPMDAAEEILNLFDGLFMTAKILRGYPDAIQLPDGTQIPIPDPKARERTKRAVVRFMKSAGANVSPGMGLGISVFGYIVAPCLSIEISRAISKKASGG